MHSLKDNLAKQNVFTTEFISCSNPIIHPFRQGVQVDANFSSLPLSIRLDFGDLLAEGL